jgi:hypothetical protein
MPRSFLRLNSSKVELLLTFDMPSLEFNSCGDSTSSLICNSFTSVQKGILLPDPFDESQIYLSQESDMIKLDISCLEKMRITFLEGDDELDCGSLQAIKVASGLDKNSYKLPFCSLVVSFVPSTSSLRIIKQKASTQEETQDRVNKLQ